MPFDFNGKRVHLMGIGGVGVGALVPLLRRQGAQVDGCDVHEHGSFVALRNDNVACAVGHHPTHVNNADVVVHTSAISVDHPELVSARQRGIPILSRGACLSHVLSTNSTAFAVTGSHGKTTTTWFLGHMLAQAGLDPTVIVGGHMGNGTPGVRCGNGPMVAEADESDGSFALIRPRVAIVTNLDAEHLRFYGGLSQLENAVGNWLTQLPGNGFAVLPNDALGRRLAARCPCQVALCGADPEPEHPGWHLRDLRLEAQGSSALACQEDRVVGKLVVPIPGAHMAVNGLMALAAGQFLAQNVNGDLGDMPEIRRRFTVHGTVRGVRMVEDYGHHPSELRATISAARLAGGRVHVLFQPHRHTRTADLFDNFVAAFDQAHGVCMLPIYSAGEAPEQGIDHHALVAAVNARRNVLVDVPALACRDAKSAMAALAQWAGNGDTCLVLGAGDVGGAMPELRRALEATP